MQHQDTWTSPPASVSLHSLATRTDQGFLKDKVPQFWSCLFSLRRCRMHLQSYLMRVGGQILWKKAEQNHQRIANDWFCSFRSWQHSSAWLHLSILCVWLVTSFAQNMPTIRKQVCLKWSWATAGEVFHRLKPFASCRWRPILIASHPVVNVCLSVFP